LNKFSKVCAEKLMCPTVIAMTEMYRNGMEWDWDWGFCIGMEGVVVQQGA